MLFRSALEARLFGVQDSVGPTAAAASTLRDLREYIENAQPPLADAQAVRDNAVATLAAGLLAQGLPPLVRGRRGAAGGRGGRQQGQAAGAICRAWKAVAGLWQALWRSRASSHCLNTCCPSRSQLQPEAPAPDDVRALAQQAIEEAKRMPEMPAFHDYSALLDDIAAWLETLRGCGADVQAALEVRGAAGPAGRQALVASRVPQVLVAVGAGVEAPARRIPASPPPSSPAPALACRRRRAPAARPTTRRWRLRTRRPTPPPATASCG